jgi:hypothetical protein
MESPPCANSQAGYHAAWHWYRCSSRAGAHRDQHTRASHAARVPQPAYVMELDADHERAECPPSAAERDVAWGSMCPCCFRAWLDASAVSRLRDGRANGPAMAVPNGQRSMGMAMAE